MNFSISHIIIVCALQSVTAFKILLMPYSIGFNSRFRNVQKLGNYISEDRHDVSLLTHSKLVPFLISKSAKLLIYEVPDDADIIMLDEINWVGDFEYSMANLKAINEMLNKISLRYCELLLQDKQLLTFMKSENYDLFIADQYDDCGKIIASYLDVPLMIYSNLGFLPWPEFYPNINSIQCMYSFICNHNVLTFRERTHQFVTNAFLLYDVLPGIASKYRELQEKYSIDSTLDIEEVYLRSVMLMNVDFVTVYPRPLMPNQFPIAGIFHENPKSLSDELEDFVKGSKEGLIVFSFGTLIDKIDERKAKMFASVFAKLPQRIVWRFSGKKPEGLGPNTLLLDWIPQNDLLGNEATKVFITHCGASGTYEAFYNAVPVVAIPLFVDQNMNADRLVNKCGMGVKIDPFHSITEDIIENALLEVLYNDTYRNNAKQQSAMMKDVPVHPRKQFLHLVNYTAKYNGAHHLISEPAISMDILTFYSLDVILFLFIVLILISFFSFYCLKFSLQFCVKNLLKKEKAA